MKVGDKRSGCLVRRKASCLTLQFFPHAQALTTPRHRVPHGNQRRRRRGTKAKVHIVLSLNQLVSQRLRLMTKVFSISSNQKNNLCATTKVLELTGLSKLFLEGFDRCSLYFRKIHHCHHFLRHWRAHHFSNRNCNCGNLHGFWIPPNIALGGLGVPIL